MKRIEVYVVQLHMSVLILGERMGKTFFEKMVKLFELLASVCTITGASIWGIVTYMNSERNELVSEVPADEKIDENMEEDSILAMAEHVVENSAKNNNYSTNPDIRDEKNITIINVEDEVKRIRSYYNGVQEQKGESQQHPIDKRVRVYYISNEVVSIEVISGYKDIDYSRIYYFDEGGELCFAFVFDKEKENRLYFKNDILLRYIDESSEVYDLYDNLEACSWYELVIDESNELLESVN